MNQRGKRWALVLAAGAGTRLTSLTRIGNGAAVPKQFCSLSGGASLLDEAIERAHAVTTPERTLIVVAAEHRSFWASGPIRAHERNLIIQPSNRGTAFGILLGIAALMHRDPEASVLLLPSDHFVAQESVLRQAIMRAFAADSRAIRFLGIRPERADPELGYIVRGELAGSGGYRIARFVEKPCQAEAEALLGQSALWNSFILVGRARSFLDLIRAQYPLEAGAIVRATQARDTGSSKAALDDVYARLPVADFSRDVVQRTRAPLEVVPVGACGWSDLGTPQRVAECLVQAGLSRPMRPTVHLSLAEAQTRYAQMSA